MTREVTINGTAVRVRTTTKWEAHRALQAFRQSQGRCVTCGHVRGSRTDPAQVKHPNDCASCAAAWEGR